MNWIELMTAVALGLFIGYSLLSVAMFKLYKEYTVFDLNKKVDDIEKRVMGLEYEITYNKKVK